MSTQAHQSIVPPVHGNLLALATSAAHASAAVRRVDGTVFARNEHVGNAHSDRMLALISEVLDASGCNRALLSGVAFEAGPGGFTNLRLACALAQGLAAALELPVCAVGTLEAQALASLEVPVPAQGIVAVINDARMGEFYVAICEIRRPSPDTGVASARVLMGPACLGAEAVRRTMTEWRAKLDGLTVTGDALAVLDGAEWTETRRSGIAARCDAAAILRLAAAPESIWIHPAQAAPQYVRNKVALDIDEQRALRAARA